MSAVPRQAKQAINVFIEGYHEHFRRVFADKVGQHGPGDQSTDDLMQDFYMRVWKGLEAPFRGDSSAKTWATRIAENMSVDFIRKLRRRRERIARGGSYIDELPDVKHKTPGAGVITQLKRAMPKKSDAELLELLVRLGMTVEEIADHLGIPVNRVKYMLKTMRPRAARVLNRFELITR